MVALGQVVVHVLDDGHFDGVGLGDRHRDVLLDVHRHWLLHRVGHGLLYLHRNWLLHRHLHRLVHRNLDSVSHLLRNHRRGKSLPCP